MTRQYRQIKNTGGHEPTTLAATLVEAGCRQYAGDILVPQHKSERLLTGIAESLAAAMERADANADRKRNSR